MIEMSCEEYKAIRERLGFTQEQLAVCLGVSRKTVNEREAGGKITREASMALRLVELEYGPKDAVARQCLLVEPGIEQLSLLRFSHFDVRGQMIFTRQRVVTGNEYRDWQQSGNVPL